jgi:hypothetical protein
MFPVVYQKPRQENEIQRAASNRSAVAPTENAPAAFFTGTRTARPLPYTGTASSATLTGTAPSVRSVETGYNNTVSCIHIRVSSAQVTARSVCTNHLGYPLPAAASTSSPYIWSDILHPIMISRSVHQNAAMLGGATLTNLSKQRVSRDYSFGQRYYQAAPTLQ